MSIFSIVVILINLILFLNYRRKLKDNTNAIIRLKRTKWTDYLFSILSGFLLFYIFYHSSKDNVQFHYFIIIILIIIAMISNLIQSGDYIIINAKGIFVSKLIDWNSINQIKRNEYNIYEITFYTNNKNKRIDFYSEEKIDELKLFVKQYSPKVYELYFAEL